MRILFAGSEFSPFAGAGCLGGMVAGLPVALTARGHEVSVALPCYRGLRDHPQLQTTPTGVEFTIQVGGKRLPAEILEAKTPQGTQLFLVRHDEFFDRSGLYGTEGQDYPDNAERFIFFSKAVLELARRVTPPPEILHVHDWQTALIPVLNKERRLPFRTVLTVHDITAQGSFWAHDFGLTNLPGDYFSVRGVEFYGRLNLLKGGLVCAEQLTAVSAHYAQEMLTQEGGAGLHAVLREQAHKLAAIPSGVDEQVWNPAVDRTLPSNYGPDDLEGKRVCREALLEKAGLDPEGVGPVFALSLERVPKEGMELVVPLLDRMLAHDSRLVIFGESRPDFERPLGIALRRHRGRLAYLAERDENLAHLMHAGADVLLVPSRLDSCGLEVMQALKYGALPLVRATGGLFPLLQDYDPSSETGNAVLFQAPTSSALWDALVRTMDCFQEAAKWQALIRRGMISDFSWERTARTFEAIYAKALRGPRSA